ncbi:hypothetical protein A2U01_0073512, partial [Trifolium medium]|nr:hypothetical protein [Trifolium medium]
LGATTWGAPVLDWATSWPKFPPARNPARISHPAAPPTCSYKFGHVLHKIYSLPRNAGQLITG